MTTLSAVLQGVQVLAVVFNVNPAVGQVQVETLEFHIKLVRQTQLLFPSLNNVE
jgi:type III secretory pathway component EscS